MLSTDCNIRQKLTALLTALLLAGLCGSRSFAQDIATGHARRIDSLASKKASTLVYLQPSKQVYETGEEIWFKAYVLDSRTLSLSAADTTLLVKLASKGQKKTFTVQKVHIEKGVASGSILLPDTLAPGDYALAGFTPGSIDGGEQEIKSFSPLRILKRISSKLDLQAGIEAAEKGGQNNYRLWAKLRSQTGSPIQGAAVTVQTEQSGRAVKGTTDKDGHVSIPLAGMDGGAGIFLTVDYQDDQLYRALSIPAHSQKKTIVQFFPEGGNLVSGQQQLLAFKSESPQGEPVQVSGEVLENGKKLLDFSSSHKGMGSFLFKAKPGAIYQARINGQDAMLAIPEILPSGISLRMVRQDSLKARFLVSSTGRDSGEQLFISAQSRGSVLGLFAGTMNRDSLFFSLPTADYPQGIIEVTVYDANMHPLAERLVYANLEQQLRISASTLSTGYGQREKVVLELYASNHRGEPVSANLGLSVHEGPLEPLGPRTGISAYAHLYSQLRGRIADPQYYFDPSNKDRRAAMDLLLLAQGWRSYLWSSKSLLESKSRPSGIFQTISGRVSSTQQVPHALFVASADRIDQNSLVAVDGNGDFRLSASTMLKGNGSYLYLKPLGSELAVRSAALSFTDPAEQIAVLLAEKSYPAPLHGKKAADTAASLPMIPGLINLKQVVIRGRGSGIPPRDKFMSQLDSTARISFTSDYVGICNWLNCASCGNGKKPVQGGIYAKFRDGRAPYHMVAYQGSDVVKEPYQYPVYTDEQLLKLFHMHRIYGYQQKRVFYEPSYPEDQPFEAPADFRNTLAWKPEILTGSDGKATVTFYTSDITGRFLATVEGTDGNGMLGSATFGFSVQRKAEKP